MTALSRFPREATAHAVIPLRATIYAEARKIALSAGNDWPRLLGAAQTLSQSPDWTDTSLARHIRQAHSLHLANLLTPVDPSHRDRSDLRDQWREAANVAAAEETSVQVAVRFKSRWPELALWACVWAAALLIATGWM